MQINMAAAVPKADSTPVTSSTTGDPNSPDQLANENTFLKLLMAQVQNQDPLNPTDGTQFIGQLVQFSQLEQLLGINQGVQTLITKGPSSLGPDAGSGGGSVNSVAQ
jgi:flagellar basal-body rod modification protein FlgD